MERGFGNGLATAVGLILGHGAWARAWGGLCRCDGADCKSALRWCGKQECAYGFGGRDSGKADGWMLKPHGLEPRAPFWGGNFAFWLIHRFQEVGSLMFSN